MALLRITQPPGTQFKIMTTDFGPIQVDLLDETLLPSIPVTTFSAQQDASAGTMGTTNVWRDTPSPGTWTKTSTGAGAAMFTLSATNGEMICQSAGLYALTGMINLHRVATPGPPLSEIIFFAAYSVNGDVTLGTSTFFPWQTQAGQDVAVPIANPFVMALPIFRRATLAIGDSVRVRFRTTLSGIAPSFAIVGCQMFAWKTQ